MIVLLHLQRFVYFFLHHGGSVDTTVEDERYRPSPIAKGGGGGGLEVVLRATFKIEDSKRFLLLFLYNFITDITYITVQRPLNCTTKRYLDNNPSTHSTYNFYF